MDDLLCGWTEAVNVIQVASAKFDNSLRRVTGGLITVIGMDEVDITMVETLPFKKVLAIYYKLHKSARFHCPTLLNPTVYATCYLSKLYYDDGVSNDLIVDMQTKTDIDLKKVMEEVHEWMLKYGDMWQGRLPPNWEGKQMKYDQFMRDFTFYLVLDPYLFVEEDADEAIVMNTMELVQQQLLQIAHERDRKSTRLNSSHT